MSGFAKAAWRCWMAWLTLALLQGCAGTAAAKQDSARIFLEAAYRPYGTGTAASSIGRRAADLFSPELLFLIRQDQRQAQGEVGLLGHDPLCHCQDESGMADIRFKSMSADPSRERWQVSFRQGTRPFNLVLELVQVDGQWRIDDVQGPDMDSLKRFLRQGLRGGGRASPRR